MCVSQAAANGGIAVSASLPPYWRLRATVSAIAIPPLLSLVSFARVARWLTGNSVPSTTAQKKVDDEALAEWVSRILYRLPQPWRHTCLKRTAVLYHLLRRAGRPVELSIGVKHDDEGAVTAHAWLVRDGAPYLENDPEHPDRFKIIARFPESE